MHNRNPLFLLFLIILILFIQTASTARTGTTKEIHIKLSTVTDEKTLSPEEQAVEEQPSPMYRVLITEQRRTPESPPKQRNPELTSEQLVVIAFDARENEINRVYIADPFIIRAETADETGDLISSRLLYRKSVDFSILLPDNPNISLLKFYKPHWTGTEFVIELIGETQLP
ncbi:MAG: hypothetical protein D8M57_04790 [Candidatus Scalindua sp. AMX11]|nr:MAG: hypothetical protein DWQ00_03805 [Candidatus Scalindua sp.]NOG84569.1 hypothetical protein [Planctomycetota bacterium]RZV92344.1 MAG: hypothetical protein EX341_04660 [Candidatus Scalindua sp. SCAELEC01]TDE66131.1 MAG: hypothetical protein D8M57_04790 [Candidatus Scalindua sp. AMX11]GJQ59105.1 MAG: hypothetical protein SCALA701_19060 [Candidatus Scalindua sp.]